MPHLPPDSDLRRVSVYVPLCSLLSISVHYGGNVTDLHCRGIRRNSRRLPFLAPKSGRAATRAVAHNRAAGSRQGCRAQPPQVHAEGRRGLDFVVYGGDQRRGLVLRCNPGLPLTRTGRQTQSRALPGATLLRLGVTTGAHLCSPGLGVPLVRCAVGYSAASRRELHA